MKQKQKRRREKQRRSCTGKAKHESYGAAKAHKKSLLLNRNHHVDVYLCQFCGFWHVGHSKGWFLQ